MTYREDYCRCCGNPVPEFDASTFDWEKYWEKVPYDKMVEEFNGQCRPPAMLWYTRYGITWGDYYSQLGIALKRIQDARRSNKFYSPPTDTDKIHVVIASLERILELLKKKG